MPAYSHKSVETTSSSNWRVAHKSYKKFKKHALLGSSIKYLFQKLTILQNLEIHFDRHLTYRRHISAQKRQLKFKPPNYNWDLNKKSGHKLNNE